MTITKSKCEEISQLISPFIDGELSGSEDALVSEHIGNCSSCNDIYVRISGTVSITKGLPAIETDSGAFVSHLRHKIDLSASRWLPESFYSLTGKFAMSAACLLLVATVGYKHFSLSSPTGSEVATVVATVAKVTPVTDLNKVPDSKSSQLKMTTVAKLDSSDVKSSHADVLPETRVALPVNSGDMLAAAVEDKSSTNKLDVTPPLATTLPLRDKARNVVSTSGIDWNSIDLKKAAANYYASPSGERMKPPVFTTFEQIQSLYGTMATDISDGIDTQHTAIDAGGMILLEVNDQAAFFPSFYKHLLNDEDYEVKSISYNQYDESFIIVKYIGGSPFEAGFNSFTSRIDTLDSVVGILSVKGGESASNLLQLTIRPAGQPVGK